MFYGITSLEVFKGYRNGLTVNFDVSGFLDEISPSGKAVFHFLEALDIPAVNTVYRSAGIQFQGPVAVGNTVAPVISSSDDRSLEL